VLTVHSTVPLVDMAVLIVHLTVHLTECPWFELQTSMMPVLIDKGMSALLRHGRKINGHVFVTVTM
jgi:hypothetical protein